MQLLHLVGATTTRFYHDLSLTYHASTVTPAGMRAHELRVAPDGSLHLRRAGGDRETRVHLGEVIDIAAGTDLVVPFMFCPAGMSVWRDLFETIAHVPVVGPPLSATIASTSKWQTKALAHLAGVPTPGAVRVAPFETAPDWTGPVIVKPDSEDNSIGLSLVRVPGDLDAALALARRAGDAALVETYIPGREIRVGVLDLGGRPRVLPVLEYHVTPDHPIRLSDDKVRVDGTGTVTRESWEKPSLRTSCPADLPSRTLSRVTDMALAMHDTLGARDYSLYDMRLSEDGDRPHLLEACSFWTFAPMSILSRMTGEAGWALEDVARAVFEQAAARDIRARARAAE